MGRFGTVLLLLIVVRACLRRSMLLAFIATALIAVAAYYALNHSGFSSAERLTSATVRLD